MQEDDAIKALVEKHGLKNWTLIAKKLRDEYKIRNRTGKQVRER